MSLSRRGFLAASALTVGAAPAVSAEPASRRRMTGAEVLAAEGYRRLRGRKVGVLTNPTGVLGDLTHLVDDMVARGAKPVAAFGPEHGFRGTAQAGGSEGDYTDPRTGIPVYDAYNVTADSLAAMYRKAGVDTVLFDIANVGARFYTYTWTMYLAMRAAVSSGASFVVLDRPNPIGGQAFGPQLDPAYATLVGLKPVVQQPGMTVGELARMFDAEFLPADTGGKRLSSLEVVPARGWRREDLFEGQWIPPSPNMPTLDTALLYPGTCLFEGTLLSEGRGTTRPFETIGAPGIDWRWAEQLNALRLPGVSFRECYFVPTFNKFANQTCGGVQVHLVDRGRVDAIRTAVAMIVTAKRLYPKVFGWRADNWVDKLSGADRLRRMVDGGAGVDEVVGAWQRELAAFRRDRTQYLLYR
ncbi:exo-beta-N-acetylmuramidase NamZ family protein [Kutzneria albida]|uniref:DUF1343 domain-containing protein n=1 Tax=Kutzneria albida DSM 43870 TaxID=1449976 RepID=W5VYR8_9PSEU|nr:DUF1343 domain-containing protein [Kutzneria albida]AHH93697.1 putative protein ybbC [Kutzneria albida DSM 43870]